MMHKKVQLLLGGRPYNISCTAATLHVIHLLFVKLSDLATSKYCQIDARPGSNQSQSSISSSRSAVTYDVRIHEKERKGQ
jgi:hypothetical protein